MLCRSGTSNSSAQSSCCIASLCRLPDPPRLVATAARLLARPHTHLYLTAQAQSWPRPIQVASSSQHKQTIPAVMSAYSCCLAIVLLLAFASRANAQTALSAWTPGVATNYGGTASGMNPNVPSYGLSNVSCVLRVIAYLRFVQHTIPVLLNP